MIWCGALWDIAEKTKDRTAQKQVEDVREKIEELVNYRDEANFDSSNFGLEMHNPDWIMPPFI